MNNLLFISILLIASLLGQSQVSILEYVPSSSNSNLEYEKFELEIKLSKKTFSNPYDESEIDVEVEFVKSGISYKVDAFWYQNFSRCSSCPDPTIVPGDNCTKNDAVNDPGYLTPVFTNRPWRARFAPVSSGFWKYRVIVTHNGTQKVTPFKFRFISGSSNRGYVKVAGNNKNFEFENGDLYFPIGMNVVHWGDKDSYNRLPYVYTMDAIQNISDNEGNMARIWMDPGRFSVEWGINNLGDYSLRQNRAFDLDEIVEYAEQENLYIQLCLEAAYQFQDGPNGSDLWQENPYNSLMVGSEDQDDFFTKPNSQQFYKRKLRYIMSRWGYSTAIFAFEMFNEVDMYRAGEANEGFWVNGNHINVRNWHDQMISHARSLYPGNRLFTSSTGWVSAGDFGLPSERLRSSNQIDFTQNHHYNSDLNVEKQRSYLAQRNIKSYNKPFLLGEYGGRLDCWLGSSNFTEYLYTPGNHFHSVSEMHNTLWSSSFSGSAGAGMFWWANHVFNDCWGGQYRYFKPLSLLIESINLLDNDYLAISSPCSCSGPKDESQVGGCGGASVDNCFPIDVTCESAPDTNFISSGISTSNNCKIEVYALMDQDKIIGWIHNKDSYWYKLPHDAGPDSDTTCEDLDDNQPTTSLDIQTLEFETITITNLPCDGVYKVEFFSAYPEYDIDNDGANEDGGIISSFTLNNIGVHCGELNFTIPKMQGLGTAPFAPDYGFKVSKVKNNWINYKPSDDASFKVNGSIDADDDDNIFYRGLDGRLHHYYYSSGQWNHEWLTNWNNSSENVLGDIAYYDGDVFYKGTDGRLHHYYYSGGQWNHEWLTNWNNSSENVGEDIAYYDGDVFYGGTDGRLHHYYYSGGQWNHEWLTNWNNNSENVGGDIAYYDGDVFYGGTDGRLHHYYYSGGQWNHEWLTDWSSTSENVGGSISVPLVPGKVYYEGVDSRLHEYSFYNGQWNHTWHTDWSNTSQNVAGEISCSNDGTHIYYRGTDEYIHEQYYIGNSQWGHDWMICYSYLENSLKASKTIAGANGRVFYQGTDFKIHVWEYDDNCNPQSFPIKTIDTIIESSLDKESVEMVSLDKKRVSVFPNPFSNRLNIIGLSPLDGVMIYDILGNTVYENSGINDSTSLIETTFWSPGIYLVCIKDIEGRDIGTYKIVK